ncbi:hypothetical protein KKD37_01205 [Patescibacteria group bacterium]|nr:hypothetical protein [Patescibacteria group bacterium]
MTNTKEGNVGGVFQMPDNVALPEVKEGGLSLFTVPEPVVVETKADIGWLYDPEAYLPPEIKEQIFRSEKPPEKALLEIAPSNFPAVLVKMATINHAPPEVDFSGHNEIWGTLENETHKSLAEVAPEVREAVAELTKNISLPQQNYWEGDYVEFGPVRAVEINTAPIRQVFWESEAGESIQQYRPEKKGFARVLDDLFFDPVLWQVNLPGFEAINQLAVASVEAMVEAELLSGISSVLSRDQAKKVMLEEGKNGSPEKWLAEQIVRNNRSRSALKSVALRSQMLVGRLAIMKGITENAIPGRSLIFLAHCVDLFHVGGIATAGRKVERQLGALTEGRNWKKGFASMAKEQEELEKLINNYNFN